MPHPFGRPCVADINLEVGRAIPDFKGPSTHNGLFGLVRLHGVPIGNVEVPFEDGRCRGQDLTAIVLARHEGAILRHLLCDALRDGSWAETADPNGWIRASHQGLAWRGGTMPTLTVAVCTRDRPLDLARCLASLDHLDYPALDLLVVDNASRGDVDRLVRTSCPRARYVREPRPGLSRARNRAIAECRSELLAFVDDDVVVDRGWARALADVVTGAPDVMAVTGLVAPYELETECQLDFERHGGFGRGFVRRWLRRNWGAPMTAGLVNTGTVGVGANMAFRRSVFDEVGTFDPALGVGTPSGGGEDLDLFFRVLRAGHTLVYEPAALVWHRHRREPAELREQIRNSTCGMLSYVLRSMRVYADERWVLAELLARLLLIYYPRRIVQSMWDPALRASLTATEYLGALASPARYSRARRRSDADASSSDRRPTAQANPPRPGATPPATLQLDLARPLPPVLPNPGGHDRLQVDVTDQGRPVGVVEIVCGGHPVGRARTADEITAALWQSLLGGRGDLGPALRAAFRQGEP